jgi:hypothetical protein
MSPFGGGGAISLGARPVNEARVGVVVVVFSELESLLEEQLATVNPLASTIASTADPRA